MNTPTSYTAHAALSILALSVLFSMMLLVSPPRAFGDGGGSEGGGSEGGGMNTSGTNDPSGICGNVGGVSGPGESPEPMTPPGPVAPPPPSPPLTNPTPTTPTPTPTPTTPTPTPTTPTPTTPTPTGEVVDTLVVPPTCGLTYYCSGQSLYRQETNCSNTFIQACSYQCVSGSCVSAPDPALSITADPILMRSGRTTVVTWSAQYVTSCTVRGTNGDAWSGTSGSSPSSPITGRTTYTLECFSLEGSPRTEQVVVQTIPTWREL